MTTQTTQATPRTRWMPWVSCGESQNEFNTSDENVLLAAFVRFGYGPDEMRWLLVEAQYGNCVATLTLYRGNESGGWNVVYENEESSWQSNSYYDRASDRYVYAPSDVDRLGERIVADPMAFLVKEQL